MTVAASPHPAPVRPSAQAAVDAIVDHRYRPLGAVVGVSRSGRVDVAAGGAANRSGTPMTVDTRFDLASVSKVVATTCALQRLVGAGEISYDDPVTGFVSALSATMGPQVSIRTVLQHRAGLWEWQPFYLAPDPDLALLQLPPRYRPDTGRHYSDLGFMILGRVVAAITGLRVDEAVTQLVIAPLAMHSTQYVPRGEDVGVSLTATSIAASSIGDRIERAMVVSGEPYPIEIDTSRAIGGSFTWREDDVVGEANDGNCYHAFGGVSGHAGLFSSAEDLLTLGRSLACADEHPLWDRDVANDTFADGPDRGQALGWRSIEGTLAGRPARLLWHSGFTGTGFGFVPGHDLSVVMLTNRLFAEHPIANDDLWEIALRASTEFEPTARESGGNYR